MKRTGAWLARFALEQIGVQHVFGIPGVHTTELFDELASSSSIVPVLVTHEGGAAFMADAVSRTTDRIGTLLVVPGAGLTHAASGIAEAYLDGVPMLVLSGGIHRASGRGYQLHDIDQQALVAAFTKARWRVESQHEIVTTIYRAYTEAMSGCPGPVYVELPVDVLMMSGEAGGLLEWPGLPAPMAAAPELIAEACKLIASARRPGLFVGWGARGARQQLMALADRLGTPVATTLQGLSSFPSDHPLHAGMSFGLAAAPAARQAFKNCDCLIAVGTRFGEIGTGSYSVEVPESLIHIDLDAEVFSRNYPARVAIQADARMAVQALLDALGARGIARSALPMRSRISRDKAAYLHDWRKSGDAQRVNPARLFHSVDAFWAKDAVVVADDGNHTFLTAELLPMPQGRHFISPTDFNCMGYAVPAAIGAKLANPAREVLAVVGDGAFLMTGNELLTAAAQQLGVIVLVFSDGELAQIAQAQTLPYKRKTCTVLNPLDLAAAARATGCEFLAMDSDRDIEPVLIEARRLAASRRPVLVDVRIDYSRRTAFTQGIVSANIKRMPTPDKLRMAMRAVSRRVT
ncbi:MAG: thiamine pyrophosphate-binding protein [Gammaproteobacteria bacterium]|nr:thiamine pyrophosphate-binding protein [Gammaproteobacteria bacterium]